MKKKKGCKMQNNANSAAIYGLGLVGAMVYYLQNATTLLEGALGFLKAILWPAFVVHKLLGFLKM